MDVATPPRPHRLEALDSLRGLAAFAVLLFHCSLMTPDAIHARMPLWVSFIPLRFLYNGYGAVMIFFVLSGYVLAIPFVHGNRPSYGAYLIRRFCRIYIPFAIAIGFAALLYSHSHPVAGDLGSRWFRGWWETTPVTPGLLLRHLAMTGEQHDMWLDSVMWSLVEEMRISLLFPFLILLCSSLTRIVVLALCLYAGAATAMVALGYGGSLITSNDFFGTWLITLRFIPFFMLGIALLKYNEAIQDKLRKLSQTQFALLFIAALMILCLPSEINNHRIMAALSMTQNSPAIKFITEVLYGIAGGFLIISVRRTPHARMLHWPPVQKLGAFSYSLYLLHMPIILFSFRLLLGVLPFWAICLIVIGASLVAAAIFHRLVEQPAQRLGKYLTKKSSPSTALTQDAALERAAA